MIRVNEPYAIITCVIHWTTAVYIKSVKPREPKCHFAATEDTLGSVSKYGKFIRTFTRIRLKPVPV